MTSATFFVTLSQVSLVASVLGAIFCVWATKHFTMEYLEVKAQMRRYETRARGRDINWWAGEAFELLDGCRAMLGWSAASFAGIFLCVGSFIWHYKVLFLSN